MRRMSRAKRRSPSAFVPETSSKLSKDCRAERLWSLKETSACRTGQRLKLRRIKRRKRRKRRSRNCKLQISTGRLPLETPANQNTSRGAEHSLSSSHSNLHFSFFNLQFSVSL